MRTWTEVLQKRLAANPAEAVAYLRVALAEAQEDPQGLLLAVQHIVNARSGIDDLGLSLEERGELGSLLSRPARKRPDYALQTCL